MLRLGRSLARPAATWNQTTRFFHSSINPHGTLGIRREDKNRWERRVPLSPDHVQALVEQGIDVIIQPSSLRIFENESYADAGAVLKEDLSSADCIIAVKEVPEELLIPNKTYMFFSHTIKAQRSNMPMLDNILSKNIRLIDYEKIVNSADQRLVRFGRYAGIAGMIDIIRALGNRLLFMRYSTPFLHLGFTHMYMNLDTARQAVRALGEEILLKGIPKDLSPMVFVFTGGDGNCSQGAREIFELLPHKYITPEELPALMKSKDQGHRFRLYGVKVGSEDYMVPKDPALQYSRASYYSDPESYECNFAQRIAPYASVIVNNTYWDTNFPRLLSRRDLRELWRKRAKGRLLAIADISCDVNGSIEAMTKSTSIDDPVFIYDPITGRTTDNLENSGILVLAVDNLPTELPKEASMHFGDMLLPFLPDVVNSNQNATYEQMGNDLPREVYSAVVTANGKLAPPFEYINKLRQRNESTVNKVLVLGSGYVAPGLVSILAQDSNNQILIASNLLEEAEKLAKVANVRAIELDCIKERSRLRDLVKGSDIVISILPQFFHVNVAELCIEFKKNMVTASYIKPEMRELDAKAKEAGITILNEIGLDPGIDHMSALKTIQEIKEQKGTVVHFRSNCGGLPAPEYADNPLHYKFSWSPRGVLEAGKNPAKYLENGKVIEVPSEKLFQAVTPIEIHPCFSMEVIPNRDSISYRETYGLQDAQTVFRGTLRYKGYSKIMWAIRQLGLLSDKKFAEISRKNASIFSWPDFLCFYFNCKFEDLRNVMVQKIYGDKDVPAHFKTDYEQERTMRAFEWFGFFDFATEFVPQDTPIDTLCNLLMERLVYDQNERDMILLQHEFHVQWANGRNDKLTSTMITFGDGSSETAMAKTVGYPLGIAAELLLAKKISTKGVIGPVTSEIYDPILADLKSRGLLFVETK